VRNLQSAFDNETRARELELAAFLRAFASTQHPGCAISMLLTKPYLDNLGQVGRAVHAYRCGNARMRLSSRP